jgi:hypothetical protein
MQLPFQRDRAIGFVLRFEKTNQHRFSPGGLAPNLAMAGQRSSKDAQRQTDDPAANSRIVGGLVAS